jgi:uncharacterized protein YigE (DUF2233 family)
VPPTAALPSDTGWLPGANGVELRQLQATINRERPATAVIVARLDPAQVRLRVAYNPEKPGLLREWFNASSAVAMINGGFFTAEYQTTALLISDGEAHGASYQGFGGMLSVNASGEIAIRALRDTPYDPNEPLEQGLQSFPTLVFPGGIAAQINDDGQRARRSVVALDQNGRLLLIVCPASTFSLTELANWLVNSDLQIDRALNLDGGPSTGMFVRAGTLRYELDSFGPLPIVLLAEPR